MITELNTHGCEFPEEMLDFIKVLLFGASKYESNNWLTPNGHNSDFKTAHDRMFHHLARSFSQGYTTYKTIFGNYREMDESGMDELLHLQVDAAMMYTRIARQIKHESD